MLKDCSLIHETTSGASLKMTIDEFNALGFDYGDSIDISFSNGFFLEDIPYFNGYYVDACQPLLVAYPEAKCPKITNNYGDDLWIEAGLRELDTASISIRRKAGYLDMQESCDIRYSNDREDFSCDEVFANFRGITAGEIQKNILYRSASPCDNRYNRARYADGLAEQAGIRCIIDLADNERSIEGYISRDGFDSPHFLSMYRRGNILFVPISTNFLSDAFQNSLKEGLSRMADADGPYLVHCTEGKDRTGFICVLLEALCGAGFSELEEDYMTTYDNYYGINRASDPERYDSIKRRNFDIMVDAIMPDENTDARSADLSACARTYLLGLGLSGHAADKLKRKLTKV